MSRLPSMPHKTVLVVGATGNVGRELVPRLRDRGARVRTLSRGVRRSSATADDVVGDVTDVVTLRRALAGVDAVFLIWPLLDVSQAAQPIRELAAHVVDVVYLSSTAIDDTAPRQSDPIVQVHADMEALLVT